MYGVVEVVVSPVGPSVGRSSVNVTVESVVDVAGDDVVDVVGLLGCNPATLRNQS